MPISLLFRNISIADSGMKLRSLSLLLGSSELRWSLALHLRCNRMSFVGTVDMSSTPLEPMREIPITNQQEWDQYSHIFRVDYNGKRPPYHAKQMWTLHPLFASVEDPTKAQCALENADRLCKAFVWRKNQEQDMISWKSLRWQIRNSSKTWLYLPEF